MRLLTLLLILFVWAAGPAMAGPFEDARAASTRGDHATAIMLLRPLADRGNAAAQFRLGVMYDNGWGVPQDLAQAMDWYRKAAEQGYAAAQFNLGVMYDNASGVPQDFVQAHKWFSLAAAQGEADAIKECDAIAAKMMPAQIAEAQKLASEWKPKMGR